MKRLPISYNPRKNWGTWTLRGVSPDPDDNVVVMSCPGCGSLHAITELEDINKKGEVAWNLECNKCGFDEKIFLETWRVSEK